MDLSHLERDSNRAKAESTRTPGESRPPRVVVRDAASQATAGSPAPASSPAGAQAETNTPPAVQTGASGSGFFASVPASGDRIPDAPGSTAVAGDASQPGNHPNATENPSQITPAAAPAPSEGQSVAPEAAAVSAAAVPATIAPKEKKPSAIWNAIRKVGEKSREKAAKKKQQEEDDKAKTANTRKRNHAGKVAIAIVILLGIGGLIYQHNLTQKQEAVKADADRVAKERAAAVAAATKLLGGTTEVPASAGSASASAAVTGTAQSQQQPAPATAGSAVTARTANPVAQTQAAAPSTVHGANDGVAEEDKYLQQLHLLKGGIATATAPTSPSALPPEISGQALPRGPGGTRSSQAAAPKVPPKAPIGEFIEGTTGSAKPAPRDPLASANVIATLPVDRSLATPYTLKVVRPTEDGLAAFIFERNTDVLLTGHWYFEGEQTPDGWTVVKIQRNFVNVVSPSGQIYRLQS